jgi:hypothetical protein
MADKNPRAKKEDAFDEPPAKGREEEAGSEDAGVQSFTPPTEGVTEDASAAAEAASALAGVSAQLMDVKRAIEQQLLATASSAAVQAEDSSGTNNIVGVGIGLAEQHGGGEPGVPVLNVYTIEQSHPSEVRSVIVESLGIHAADSQGDVPIQVVATGVVDAQPHRFRIRPAPGGVSVGHFRITAGTIGCLATGRTAPRSSRLMILSNNHVLANSNNAVFGDCITQPGPADGGRCPQDQIAVLERFVPINFAGGANFVDCATGWCWADRVRRELVYLSGGVPAFFRISAVPVAPVLGMIVGKSGRTTQLTTGRIVGISETIRVNYGAGRVALFVDQISIRGLSGDFSAGGDSGSSIWTWNTARNPVGLLFAGGGGVTFANKIGRVLTALDIRLFT